MAISSNIRTAAWGILAGGCFLAAALGIPRSMPASDHKPDSCPAAAAVELPASPYPSRLMSVTPDGTLLYVLYLKNGAVYFTNRGTPAQYQANPTPQAPITGKG